MRAFHGDPPIKQKYLDRVRMHRAADELVRGVGWEPGNGHKARGCAIGCTLEKYEHSAYETELGIPEVLARLEDWLFENLPEDHLSWPERVLDAIPVGADLSGVWSAWCGRMLRRRLERLPQGDDPWLVDVVRVVREAAEDAEAGTLLNEARRYEAADAAWAAWAARAAWVAWAARAAWVAWAAEAAEVRRQATDLLELLSAAPVLEQGTYALPVREEQSSK